ncbi:MAG TPA: cation diffusion facilitator family transporter [Fimbriimonadaceae bacterium]|nr:cation diffusion facilitator family transporter [Fimbriimonadaceae bacterium]
MSTPNSDAQLAGRAAALSLASTIVVVAVKAAAAWSSGSISVLAEAIQSTVDILMSALAVATIAYAAKPADRDHPYGHGKAESLASAFQMLVVLGSGVYILFEAYQRLIAPESIRWDYGAAAMVFAVVANLGVSAYLRRVAAQTGSTALSSEALHLRGDSLSSGGVLVGMLLVGATGQSILDPVAALFFTLLAMGLAAIQLRKVIHPLMDGAMPPEELKRLEQVLHDHPEVRGFHNVRTRFVGAKRWVELHVMLDDAMTFVAAHEMAEQIEGELGNALSGAKVSIHYEPYEAELAHRAREHPEDA